MFAAANLVTESEFEIFGFHKDVEWNENSIWDLATFKCVQWLWICQPEERHLKATQRTISDVQKSGIKSLTCKEEASLGSTLKGRRKVWKSGGASINVVGIICTPWWNRVNWSIKICAPHDPLRFLRLYANYRSDLIIALSWLTRVIRHP